MLAHWVPAGAPPRLAGQARLTPGRSPFRPDPAGSARSVAHRHAALALVALALCALQTGCGVGPTVPGDAGAAAVDDGGARVDGGGREDGGPGVDGGERADGGARGDGGSLADGGLAAEPADPTCTRNGCLREFTSHGDYAQSELRALVEVGVRVDNGYSVYAIRYFTDGRESTGTVVIPYDPLRRTEDVPLHIVGNQHGTTGVGDACALSSSVLGAGLAGTFGARGMIGVATDYAGLGTPGVHPYLVARVEGTSALDALRAARQLALLRGALVSGRYALVGLSQGGHATLAAAALHRAYAPELELRAVSAAAPASVWPGQWSAAVGLAGPHQALHALLVYAWADHYGAGTLPLWSEAMAPRIASLLEQNCVGTLDGTSLPTVVPQDPAELFDPSFLAAYRSGAFDAYPFLQRGFAANALGPYAQTAPLRLYQGDADTVVAEPYTRALVTALRDGGVDVDYQVVPGGTHTDVAFGYLAFTQSRTEEALTWLRERLDAPPDGGPGG